MTTSIYANMIGDCSDAREWYGIDVACSDANRDHPSRLHELEDDGAVYLLCAPVHEVCEFIIDSRDPVERLRGRIYSLNCAMDRAGFA